MARIVLGTDTFCDAAVDWQATSGANPHLMVVELPCIGKTEALLNICEQLAAQSITPVVFSYYPDIDERLAQRLGEVQLDHQQLGFDPMHFKQQSPHAHIDNAGMLRDIFAAMFPDLGDGQLETFALRFGRATRGSVGVQRADQRTLRKTQAAATWIASDMKPLRPML